MIRINFGVHLVSKMYEDITHDEFMKLPTEDIKKIVSDRGLPRVGVLIPDGTRRWGIINLEMDPDSNEFEKRLFEIEHNQIIDKLKIFFDLGLHTLFMPGVTHGNFMRSEQYVKNVTEHGLKYIFNDEDWFKFYKEYDVKVKIYGDLDFVRKAGYGNVVEWIQHVEDQTKNNKSHILFHGLACSNYYENMRIIDIAIDHYKQHNKHPSREELIRLYYGMQVDEVDFFLRTTVMRDSDIQPPLISGRKTQFYFPVSPVLTFTEEMYREILFDLLFCRVITMSKKHWQMESLSKAQQDYLKRYYDKNKGSIIGIGKRIGNLWTPLPQVYSVDDE